MCVNDRQPPRPELPWQQQPLCAACPAPAFVRRQVCSECWLSGPVRGAALYAFARLPLCVAAGHAQQAALQKDGITTCSSFPPSPAGSCQRGTLPVVDQQPHRLYPGFSPGQVVLLMPGHPCRLFQRASHGAGEVQRPQWWILPSDFLSWSLNDPASPQENQRTSSWCWWTPCFSASLFPACPSLLGVQPAASSASLDMVACSLRWPCRGLIVEAMGVSLTPSLAQGPGLGACSVCSGSTC